MNTSVSDIFSSPWNCQENKLLTLNGSNLVWIKSIDCHDKLCSSRQPLLTREMCCQESIDLSFLGFDALCSPSLAPLLVIWFTLKYIKA